MSSTSPQYSLTCGSARCRLGEFPQAPRCWRPPRGCTMRAPAPASLKGHEGGAALVVRTTMLPRRRWRRPLRLCRAARQRSSAAQLGGAAQDQQVPWRQSAVQEYGVGSVVCHDCGGNTAVFARSRGIVVPALEASDDHQAKPGGQRACSSGPSRARNVEALAPVTGILAILVVHVMLSVAARPEVPMATLCVIRCCCACAAAGGPVAGPRASRTA